MDISDFERCGYQIVREVVSAETVQAVGDFLAARTPDAIRVLDDSLQLSNLAALRTRIDELSNSPDLDRCSESVKQVISGHFPLEVRLAQDFWAIPRQPRVRQLIETIFDSEELYMHLPPTARFIVPGNKQGAVPAHQDISYNTHMSDFITMWMPFVRIDHKVGGVVVFEGTGGPHQIPCDSRGKFWIDPISTAGCKRVHCEMDVGDVLIMNKYIVHESMPNTSNQIRYSTDFRFFARPHTSTKHALDLQSWEVIPPGEMCLPMTRKHSAFPVKQRHAA